MVSGLGLAWNVTPAFAGVPPSIDIARGPLSFTNPVPIYDGETFLGLDYPQLLQGDAGCIQAELRLVSSSSLGELYLESPELDGAPPDEGIWMYVDGSDYDGDDRMLSEARVTFSLDFLLSEDCESKGVPVTLLNVCAHVTDVDDRQFVSFVGPTSSYITPSSALTLSTVGDVVTASETNGVDNDDDDNRDFWAEVEYASAQSIEFSTGIGIGGDYSAFFEVLFDCATWTTAGPDGRKIDLDHYLRRAEESALPDTK